MKNQILYLFLMLFLGIKVYAQKSEIINSENGTLNIKNIKEGTKDYLVYMADNTKQKERQEIYGEERQHLKNLMEKMW